MSISDIEAKELNFKIETRIEIKFLGTFLFDLMR
jgi:hypothetical protein